MLLFPAYDLDHLDGPPPAGDVRRHRERQASEQSAFAPQLGHASLQCTSIMGEPQHSQG